MTKYIFVGDPNKYKTTDIAARVFYYMHNNRTYMFEATREMHINIVVNNVQAAQLNIMEDDVVEVFCVSGQHTINKFLFDIITIIVEKVNDAKHKDCNIHVIT
jgi:hypothetical protein